MWIAPDATTPQGRSKEERRPATDPPRRLIARVPPIDAGGDEGEDPKALVSLLERVLQKISSIPGALEAISSDPSLLRELQQHELLFYPSSTPTRTSLSALDSSAVELQSSQQELIGDDDDGDDFPVTFVPPQHTPASSSSVAIPAMTLLPPPPMSASLASNSPSFSMGMLSMSPGTYSQDGEPVSALWPRQPNEFAFTQEDESKEDDLYNEVLCSDDDDDDDANKVFEMDMEDDAPFRSEPAAVLRDEDTLQDDDDDDDDDGDDAEIQYETMRLRIVREKNKTGFEPSQEWEAHAGVLLGGQYSIHGLIGEAVFSQTYKATDTRTGQLVCLKVIKNNKEYFDQGLDEIRVLEHMRNSVDDMDSVHIVRLLDYFYYKEHLILVTELLRDNLYEFSRLVRTQPAASALSAYFTLPRLKKIAIECLEALAFLHRLHIVHCDLKPENIVMKSFQKCEIKLIDFGSASFVSDELTFYVQSRSYRAPEVILGRRYDEKVDVWCILAELYTGHVLFANDSVPSLLGRMISILGAFPTAMLRSSPDVAKYFDADFVLRSPVPPKTSLWHALHCADHLFIDFLQSLLTVNPSLRVTAAVAIEHPWLQTNVFGRH
ncbi:CMGC/DYRK protein kinase [Saprolegnia parasitica CBS 223.65]|uniref:CMGC/DYRK protein kinase n=1 Tax=Saprolegnia parasitica (strain CBS 223.65) TaxID=695850 RepID=A0A067BZN7_SAPPC|nr:CMGC/DYRK protein kinase [Saprolegnia parasitica CBS 223.65]KDO19761.1 CMGC/DYRK protein kinase [Saprolegnia parasitica CBS 223.65]|eukprot:XP_012209523.1 CMGC/DYRK protein kinase [Saprolegnia parasitica CBS 223.65]